MKRIACLLLGVALAGTGCLNVQNLEVQPAAPAPAPPPPPPVMPGQITEANAPEVLQALTEELDRAATEPVTPGVPPAPPGPAVTPRN
jgi:hypothetical protein